MPRSCTICLHPERKAIDETLFRDGTSFRNVSKQFGVTASALYRHKQHSTSPTAECKSALQLEKLPPRKLAYIQGRLDGKSKKRAALDAGFSPNMAKHAADKIETKDVRAAFARLIRETVPPELIAKAIADGLSATETKFFSHEGTVQDKREVPAWSERRQYAELAAEYGGYHLPSKSDQAQAGGGVILILPGGQPQSTPVVPVDRKVVDAVPNAVNPLQNLLNGEEADGQDSY
jgi:hypothetical protein